MAKSSRQPWQNRIRRLIKQTRLELIQDAATWPVAQDRRELFWMALEGIAEQLIEHVNGMHEGQGIMVRLEADVYDFDSRDSDAYDAWRDEVLRRAGHRCQQPDCDETQDLHAHHIESWESSPTKRFDLDNGECLCRRHHADRHPEVAALILSGGKPSNGIAAGQQS